MTKIFKLTIIIFFSFNQANINAETYMNFVDDKSQILLNQDSTVLGDTSLMKTFPQISFVQNTGGTGPTQGYSSNTINYNSVHIPREQRTNILDELYDPSSPYYIYGEGNISTDITWLKHGFKLAEDASIYIEIPFPLACPFDLHGGLLELGIDWHLSTSTTISPQGGGGRIKGNGYALIMDGNLIIPPGEYLKFVNDTVIEGLGHDLIISNSARLIVDMNTTLTLRNVIIRNLRNMPIRPTLVMSDTSSKLALQNVKITLDGDYIFSQGSIFIDDDVLISGTSQFIFESNQEIWISDFSTLIFDHDTTFSYAPKNGSRNTLKMKNSTSSLFLNEAKLNAPGNSVNNGIELTKGTLFLDNKVTLKNTANAGYNENQSKAITFGNGLTTDNINIKLLASSVLDIKGYIDYKNTD